MANYIVKIRINTGVSVISCRYVDFFR